MRLAFRGNPLLIFAMGGRFVPDERCLGGVHEIHAEYTNMRHKLLRATPEVAADVAVR